MTSLAFALVLSAAFVHASWNVLAKRAGASGPAFVWLFSTLTSLVYLPAVLLLIFWQRPHLDALSWIAIAGSFGLHLAYFLTLQHGYRVGDLSVVYPLARGTGPTLSTLAAILFLGERPTPAALGGALLVIMGIFLLSGGRNMLRGHNVPQGVVFGALTGVIIAGYTLWDKHAVSVVLVPPLLLDYGSSLGRMVFLFPFVTRRRDEVHHYWTHHRLETIGVALLSPLSYILVLTALTFAPVSYIAPAREVSVLIAILMGSLLLHEGQIRQRMGAASLILVGLITLAVN